MRVYERKEKIESESVCIRMTCDNCGKANQAIFVERHGFMSGYWVGADNVSRKGAMGWAHLTVICENYISSDTWTGDFCSLPCLREFLAETPDEKIKRWTYVPVTLEPPPDPFSTGGVK